MSSKTPEENQTTIALTGGNTVPAGNGFPLPGERSNLLPIGTRLGEFELTGLVGEGGFGIVYLAYDHSLHRQVAVKEYIPASLANRGADNAVVVISDQHAEPFRAGLNSFINEARLLAQFDHPSLLKVYRFWEANGTAYMAMPYYEGITLRKALKSLGGPPDEEWLKHLLRSLLDALSVMHEAQCYHRDIAPDNILILANGRPVLLDFGAARRVIADMTQAPTIILKPGYAPVEQYGEDPSLRQGPWTDVYGLSAVIYSAIVGKAPQASISRYMSDGLKPLTAVAAGRYGEQFLAAIDRGLAVRPADRPQSIAEFRGLLGLVDRRQRPRPTLPTLAPEVPQPEPAAPPVADADATVLEQPAAVAAPPPPQDTRPQREPVEVIEAPPTAPIVIYLLSAVMLIAALGAAAWYWWPRPAPEQVAVRPTVPSEPAQPIGTPPDAPAAPAREPADSAPPPSEAPAQTPPAEAAPAAPEPPPAAERRPLAPDELLSQVLAAAVPRHAVTASADNAQVAIGSGVARFSVSSSVPGYLYVLKLGPAADEIHLVFPNLADQMNRIAPGKPMSLPTSSWARPVTGGPGVERYIAMVSDEPRDFGLIDARTRGPFKVFRPESLARLQRDYAGAEPLLAGIAVCPVGVPCSAAYGAAEFTIETVTAPRDAADGASRASAQAERVEKGARASHTRTGELAPGKRVASSKRCSDILERGSLGEVLTPEQMAYLKKECGQ